MIMLNKLRIFAVSLLLATALTATAQDRQKDRPTLNVDAVAFFANNEMHTPLCKGYTLPGYRLTPTLKYTFSRNAEIEAGAYMLHFWGTNTYPNSNYFGMPDYSATGNSKGLHVLPSLRLRINADCGLSIILGNLVNPSHNLIEPLYASERLLTADPEAGLQLLYRHPRVKADMWVDWRTFIYNHSPYGENFIFGINATPCLTKPDAPVRLTMPVQVVVEHLGGEIDDTDLGVSTLLNAAAGLKLECLRRTAGVEAYALISRQVAGKLWGTPHGTAMWAQAFGQYRGFKLGVGAFHAKDFISLCGLPIFGVVSNIDGTRLNSPTTLVANLSYNYRVAKSVDLQAYASLYSLLKCTTSNPDKPNQKATTSFIFGVTAKASISQLLWRKKQRLLR